MGCASSLQLIEQPIEQGKKKETIEIQYLQKRLHTEQPEPRATTDTHTSDGGQLPLQDIKIRRQQEKIEFLQQSKNFMRLSIETSNYVNQAIMSLAYNPLLYDQAYHKLLGINKKTLQKKQNRVNNLCKRQMKAEQELKKVREKHMEKCKSDIFQTIVFPKDKYLLEKQKQNREEPNYRLSRNRESLTHKICKMQLLLDSQHTIHQ